MTFDSIASLMAVLQLVLLFRLQLASAVQD